MSGKAIRVHLKTQSYNSVKTIRVQEKAKNVEIIKEALIKNHIPLTEIDQYELIHPDAEGGVVEMVLKTKGSLGMPTQSLNDKAFMNPLYGNANVDGDDYEEVDDKDIYELLEKETELRQATEARAVKAEQGMAIALHRIKDLEAQVEALKEQQKNAVVSESSGELEKLKKKNAKLKVDYEKIKTSLEIKDEIINDLKAELEELRAADSGSAPEKGEEELSDYMHRASFHFTKAKE